MSENGAVWIGKILSSDAVSQQSLVLVRGIFASDEEARGCAEAFGCDCVVLVEPGYEVILGQVAIVVVKDSSMKQMRLSDRKAREE